MVWEVKPAELEDRVEPWVKEWEASFALRSVAWVAVWGGAVY